MDALLKVSKSVLFSALLVVGAFFMYFFYPMVWVGLTWPYRVTVWYFTGASFLGMGSVTAAWAVLLGLTANFLVVAVPAGLYYYFRK